MKTHNLDNKEEKKLTPGQIAERDELGLLLTMIVDGSTYDKETGIWDYSGNEEFMRGMCGD